jgi:hypothetical protein
MSGAQGFTYFRVTLLSVQKMRSTKNVTLSLPGPLLRKFRILAAERNQSMTHLMTEAIRRMVDEDSQVERSKRRAIARMRGAKDWGTHGVANWTREELHERRVR